MWWPQNALQTSNYKDHNSPRASSRCLWSPSQPLRYGHTSHALLPGNDQGQQWYWGRPIPRKHQTPLLADFGLRIPIWLYLTRVGCFHPNSISHLHLGSSLYDNLRFHWTASSFLPSCLTWAFSKIIARLIPFYHRLLGGLRLTHRV